MRRQNVILKNSLQYVNVLTRNNKKILCKCRIYSNARITFIIIYRFGSVGTERKSTMSPAVYVSFLFGHDQLLSNGILSHQVLRFTYFETAACPASVRIDSVLMGTLIEMLKRQIRGKNRFAVLDRRSGYDYKHIILYAIPGMDTRRTNRILRVTSSHQGACEILFDALKKLGCEYSVRSHAMEPNFKYFDDSPATWTMYVSESPGYHELRLVPGCQNISVPDVCGFHVQNIRLADLLFLFEYTHAINPHLIRYEDIISSNLALRRSCEKFQFPETSRSTAQIAREIRIRLDRVRSPLPALVATFFECLRYFLC